MNKSNKRVQIGVDEILKHYFCVYWPHQYAQTTKFRQICADKSLNEIDVTKVVNQFYLSIDTFLGANCSSCADLNFNAVVSLFLDSKRYTKQSLSGLYNLENIEETDLSDNNFEDYDYVWDLGSFLYYVCNSVAELIEPYYDSRFKEAIEWDEYEFKNTGICGGICDRVEKDMNKRIKEIVKKLVPNLKNTKLKIRIDKKGFYRGLAYELIEEILQSHKFDGCYIYAPNFSPSVLESLGITNKEELYYYPTQAFVKQKIK